MHLPPTVATFDFLSRPYLPSLQPFILTTNHLSSSLLTSSNVSHLHIHTFNLLGFPSPALSSLSSSFFTSHQSPLISLLALSNIFHLHLFAFTLLHVPSLSSLPIHTHLLTYTCPHLHRLHSSSLPFTHLLTHTLTVLLTFSSTPNTQRFNSTTAGGTRNTTFPHPR